MQCPKCQSRPLRATKIEQGLSAMGCMDCKGALITLIYYRDWIDRTPTIKEIDQNEQSLATALVEINDSKSALSCPKCSRLMNKYKISGQTENRIDLCSNCDEVWLDGGEWELLKILELAGKVPLVFTEHWQKELREKAGQKAREERLLQFVSQDDLAEAKKIKEWLSNHSEREKISFYINHK